MPQFAEYTPIAPVNDLANFAAAGAGENQVNIGRQQVQAATMANDYTRQTQPAQVKLLLGALGDMNDASSGAPPAQTDASASTPPSLAGRSLLTGDMPVSADAETQQAVGREAQAQGINPEWAMRTHYAESGASKSPYGDGSTSPAGAKGPMQLMDATADSLGVNSGDYADNIRGGVKYLGQMKAKYGNPVLASAAYNAGPGRVDDFLAGKGSLPPETVAYVGKVFGNGDGAALLRDAFNGAHGHPIGGVQPTGGGLQQVQMDSRATAAVRQLVAQERYYTAMPDGKGARAAAAIQSQLDNIAGPGGIVDPRSGMVFRVPGSDATRFAAAQATKSGEIAPLTTLEANKAAIEQQTHAANKETDLRVQRRTPEQIAPGHTLTTPDAVLPPDAGPPGAPSVAPVTAPVAAPIAAPPIIQPQQQATASPPPAAPPGGAGGSASDVLAGLRAAPPVANPNPLLSVASPANAAETVPQNGLTGMGQPPVAPRPAAAAPAPQMQQQVPVSAERRPAVWQAPADAERVGAEAEAKRTVEMQAPVLEAAKESQTAINRIAQARQAIKQATANGVPPGYFSPALAEAAAAAKSLGIDLTTLGINPAAIQNEQVAREALTQINGEILKSMFPQRITNADVTAFGANLAKFGMDPAALEPILEQADRVAHYSTNRADNMLAYKEAHKGSLIGWDSQFYRNNGYGPNLVDAVHSGTVPAQAGADKPAASAPAQVYTIQNPFKPTETGTAGRAQVQALPSGTPFLNPATGKVILRH